jgi:hypothetical protein
LANVQFGRLFEELPLAGQFRREPFVGRIEQGDPLASRRRDAPVAGRADTGAILPEQAEFFLGIGCQDRLGCSGGSIVHNAEFEMRIVLSQNGSDGSGKRFRSVPGWNNAGYQVQERLLYFGSGNWRNYRKVCLRHANPLCLETESPA